MVLWLNTAVSPCVSLSLSDSAKEMVFFSVPFPHSFLNLSSAFSSISLPDKLTLLSPWSFLSPSPASLLIDEPTGLQAWFHSTNYMQQAPMVFASVWRYHTGTEWHTDAGGRIISPNRGTVGINLGTRCHWRCQYRVPSPQSRDLRDPQWHTIQWMNAIWMLKSGQEGSKVRVLGI